MELPIQLVLAIALVVGVGCSIIGQQINQRKNRSISEAWFACLLLGPLGLLMIALAPASKPRTVTHHEALHLPTPEPAAGEPAAEEGNVFSGLASPSAKPGPANKRKRDPAQMLLAAIGMTLSAGLLVWSIYSYTQTKRRLGNDSSNSDTNRPGKVDTPKPGDPLPGFEWVVKRVERNNLRVYYGDDIKKETAEKLLNYLDRDPKWKGFVEDLAWSKKAVGEMDISMRANRKILTMTVGSTDYKSLVKDEFGLRMATQLLVWDVFPRETVGFKLYDRDAVNTWESIVTPE